VSARTTLTWVGGETLERGAAAALYAYIEMTGETGRPRIPILHVVGPTGEQYVGETPGGFVSWLPRCAALVRSGAVWLTMLSEVAMLEIGEDPVDPSLFRPGEITSRLDRGDLNTYTGILGVAWHHGLPPLRFYARAVNVGQWRVSPFDETHPVSTVGDFDVAWQEFAAATRQSPL
jgi:hypothetical protein